VGAGHAGEHAAEHQALAQGIDLGGGDRERRGRHLEHLIDPATERVDLDELDVGGVRAVEREVELAAPSLALDLLDVERARRRRWERRRA